MSASAEAKQDSRNLGWFEKYIYLWIILAGAGGLLLGKFLPGVSSGIERASWQGVSLPLVVAMFFVMLPPMARIQLQGIKKAALNVRPLMITLVANWLIAPALMWLLARVFIPEPEYRAGLILLGLAPCTAMVLFWIYFAKGNLVQGVIITAINAISTLILYSPMGTFYLGVGGVPVPFMLILFERAALCGAAAAGGADVPPLADHAERHGLVRGAFSGSDGQYQRGGALEHDGDHVFVAGAGDPGQPAAGAAAAGAQLNSLYHHDNLCSSRRSPVAPEL